MTPLVSVITPTCRNEPRWDLLVPTLAAQARAHSAVRLEWIVVDDRLWHRYEQRRYELVRALQEYRGHGMHVVHVPPKPSRWRGPYRETHQDMADVNGARNTGLAFARGDYVVYIDDCCAVTSEWLSVVLAARERGYGLRGAYEYVEDIGVPSDGMVIHQEWDNPFERLPPLTVGGSHFGFPRVVGIALHGFDEAYGGQRRCNYLDFPLRAERSDLIQWYGRKRGAILETTRTHTFDEISTDPRVFAGLDAEETFVRLTRDESRILPFEPPEPWEDIRDRVMSWGERTAVG